MGEEGARRKAGFSFVWYKKKMTAKDTDIAWLAGIIDGEGCFSVKRPPKTLTKSGHKRKGYQLWLVICNTSGAMMLRVARILDELGVVYPQPVMRWKGARATRIQYWIHIQKREEVLKITEALLPHLTAKRTEAEIVIWYLRRAIRSKKHRVEPIEAQLLESMASIKKNGGAAPDEIADLLQAIH